MKTKHLLGGVAVIAALALSAPAWAQPANPSGGNAMGLPGPNPGGPGLTPYSGGAPPPMAAPPTSAPPPSMSETTSATPPVHRHARAHRVVSTHQMLHAHGPKSGTDTTAQLNQAELARLQAGAPPMGTMPPPAPMPSPSGGNSMGMPGPNAGGPGLTPYSGAPPR